MVGSIDVSTRSSIPQGSRRHRAAQPVSLSWPSMGKVVSAGRSWRASSQAHPTDMAARKPNDPIMARIISVIVLHNPQRTPVAMV